MSSQYNKIGGHYSALKQLPLGLLELAAVKQHIGDVRDLDVLDLACGTGDYSRKLVEWGARKVVGLDISEGMVNKARRRFAGDNRLDFRVADCSKPLDVGKFDLVLAIWFLNYAGSAEELTNMWRNISRCLKPGGRCLGITINQDMLQQSVPDGPRFGLSLNIVEHVEGGVKFQICVHSSPLFMFESFMLEREIYEKCAEKAGIPNLNWMPPTDPMNPRVDFESFLRCPHFRLFTCNVE
ncbi:hypothetical protein BDV12DRAFT_181368 [Aspergillus spectabilis]